MNEPCSVKRGLRASAKSSPRGLGDETIHHMSWLTLYHIDTHLNSLTTDSF